MQEKRPNHLLIAILVFQIIFIIVLVVSLSRVFQSPKIDPDDREAQPSVTIMGLDETFPEFSNDYIKEVENQLFLLVQQNNVGMNFGTSVAEIRQDSINHVSFKDEEFDFYNFIVDIPELSQSYQLFLTVSAVEANKYIDPNAAIVPLCLSDAEVKIYSDFNCEDIYNQKTRNLIGLNYIPYFDSDKYYVNPRLSTLDSLVVVVFYRVNGIADADTALDELKNSIRTLGISPELFTYNVNEFIGD